MWGAGKRVPESERAGWGKEGLRNHSISTKKATSVCLTTTHAFSLKVLLLWFSMTRGGRVSVVFSHCQKTYRPSNVVFSFCHGQMNLPSKRASHPCRMVPCKAWNARRSCSADGLPGVLLRFRCFPFCDSVFKSLRDMPVRKDTERKWGSAGSS